MDVKLVVQKRGKPGQKIHLRSAEMILGRQKGCGVRIPSGEVSRQHCLLSFTNDLLSVEDLASANGTFLNGRRIMKREFVRPGDKLKVGPVTLLVQYQLTQAAIDRLLQEDEEAPVISGLDDVEVLPDMGGEDEVELVLEENEGPLVADEPLDLPSDQDPLAALRAIEDDSAPAPPPPAAKKKKATAARKPPPAPVPDDDNDLITIAPAPPPRQKLTNVPKAPAASAEPEEESADEPSPDASQILGHKNWQLPTGEDIRDILAQIEKGKKKS